jgi:hypothetical protein
VCHWLYILEGSLAGEQGQGVQLNFIDIHESVATEGIQTDVMLITILGLAYG